MNKTCARCEKTVYPTEELKCLDKTWHKGCFKCQECGMTLNMRTYKGYGKLPYCESSEYEYKGSASNFLESDDEHQDKSSSKTKTKGALKRAPSYIAESDDERERQQGSSSHVPKAKHTTMAETPELKRIAENTKIQSNVKYHADFEKSKGKFTQVADDPETLRIKANTKIISNVAYHGELEKKAQMEKQRQINENGELVDVPSDNYHQQLESYATEMLPPAQVPNLPPKNHYQTPNTHHQSPNRNYKQETYKPEQYEEYKEHNQNKDYHQNKQDYHQNKPDYHQNKPDYHQNRQEYPSPPQQYSDQYYRQQQRYEDYPQQQVSQPTQQYVQQKYDEYQTQYAYGQYQQAQQYGVGSQQKIGRIQDYDPLSDGPRAVPNTQRASSTLIYNSDPRKAGTHQPAQSGTRHIGRVADLDPLAQEPAQHTQRSQPAQHNHNQRVYIAMYDYQANDSDEVSFREGDLISNVSSIDEGWMTGQVLRTGRTGMLPANYVELASNTALH